MLRTQQVRTQAQEDCDQLERNLIETRNLTVAMHVRTHQLFWANADANAAELGTAAGKLFRTGQQNLANLLANLSIEHDKTVVETDIEFLRLFKPDVLPEQCGANFNPADWTAYFVPPQVYIINQDGTVTIQ